MKILILEDNADSAESLGMILNFHGYETVVARDGSEALDAISCDHIDAAIIDLLAPNFNGWEFIDTLEEHNIDLPVMVVSGYADVEPPSKHRHIPTVKKPYYADDVLKVLKELIHE